MSNSKFAASVEDLILDHRDEAACRSSFERPLQPDEDRNPFDVDPHLKCYVPLPRSFSFAPLGTVPPCARTDDSVDHVNSSRLPGTLGRHPPLWCEISRSSHRAEGHYITAFRARRDVSTSERSGEAADHGKETSDPGGDTPYRESWTHEE